MGKNKVIVFVKNPVPGKVKTRLAKTIGNKQALEIYLELLSITRQEVLKVQADKEVWYAWKVINDDIWDEDIFYKKVQVQGDLGEKMKHAFHTSFLDGYKKVVLIGSDCPTLTRQILEEAYEKLENHDVVFGPSKDGGYYLIGMRSFHPQVLEDINWSTEQVMAQTEKQAQEIGLTLAKLKPLNDIDTEEDWKEYLVQVTNR